MGEYKYYLVSTLNSDFHTLDWFYKCQYSSLGCQHLFSSYGLPGPELLIDEINNEVSLLAWGNLLVTDSKIPIYYTGASGQLGDNLYVLSWDFFEDIECEGYFCRTYIYNLNRCNLDYKGCEPLPIQYTASYDITPSWEANETKQEISLYDDYDNETIIFTYGERPRCYADGCELLEKTQ